MKKLLLITILLIGFTTTTIAQPRTAVVDSATDTTQLATISQKIDTFIASQQEITANLEKKINKANVRLQDLQNQSSLRWLMRDMVPLLIMLIIGGFIIFITFIITRSIYNNNKLKYDTLLRCTEMTGSVPNIFLSSSENIGQQRIARRTNWHVVIAVISGVFALFMMLIASEAHGIGVVLALIFCFVAALISSLLFIQIYQRSNRENTGANQQ